jgi:hydrogenase maturation protease
MGDDGAGVHLVHQLAVKLKRTDVSVIDAGTVPDLFALVDEGVRKLIFVDAVRAGEPPGSVYRLKLDDIESQKELPFSLHDLTLIDNLKLMGVLDRKPESVVIIGIEPAMTEFGTGLSPEVKRALPQAIALVIEEIEEFSKLSTEVR